MLTGDSLFVGDAARPDLAVEAREGAEGLFHSLRRLVELGDGVEVYPGHVAGSLCGKAMSSKASTTIGFERRFNPALASDDVADFVAESARRSSAPRPPNMERIVELNRGPFVAAQPRAARALPLPADGAQVVDVRPVEAFAAGHHRGRRQRARLRDELSTKAAFVVDAGRPVVVAAGTESGGCAGDSQLALRRAVRHRRLRAGGGPETLGLVAVDELDGLLEDGASSSTSGRRTSATRATSRAAATSRIGCSRSARPIFRRIDPSSRSASPDPRAAIAASILAARGYDARAVAEGGVDAWREAGKPTVEFRRCGG